MNEKKRKIIQHTFLNKHILQSTTIKCVLLEIICGFRTVLSRWHVITDWVAANIEIR